MLTQEIVSWIQEDFAPGYSRAKILSYLKRAQHEVFGTDCAQTMFLSYGDDTSPLPILSTTDGELKYAPSADNLVDSDGNAISLTTPSGYAVSIRRIRRVFKSISVDDFSDTDWFNKKYTGRNIGDYQKVPGQPFDKTAAEDAYWVFAENPGTHTDKYYIEMYMGPIDLTAETIPMSIDTDRFAEGIFRAVRGYIEESRTGAISDLLDGPPRSKSWRSYWLPRIRNSLNHGSSEYRDYMFPVREAG